MLTEYSHKVTDPSPTRDSARTAQLQKILESRTFRSTEVLKRLLEYLGRQAMDGKAEDLKEYTVGIEAFGKPEGYDPKTDSSVRVQAGKLRQKLDEYYRTEGVSDPLIIELPKGHFELAFQSVLAEVPTPPARKVPRASVIVTAGACLAAILAIAYAWRLRVEDSSMARYRSPDIQEIWGPFFDDSRPAVVSLGLPLFAKVGNSFFRDPVKNDWDKLKGSPELAQLEKMGQTTGSPVYSYTGSGEATAAFELARIFLAGHKDLNLVFSNALSWDDIERSNVIFVGPPKYNLQLHDLPVQLDFAIDHSRIMNLKPRAGEPRNYYETWTPEKTLILQGHALISRLPGLHGSGSIMMLASTSTEGTRAAVEYVSRPDYAARLVQSLRGKDGRIPRYFQAVVRAQFKSQVPIHVEQVSVHVLGN
jgi:hypothetical protein